MVCPDEMRIFVQHHILHGRPGLFRQAQAEGDLPFCRHAYAPARFHLPHLQYRALPAEHLCEQREYLVAHLRKKRQRVLPGHGAGALLLRAARKGAHAGGLDPLRPPCHKRVHLCQRRTQGRRHRDTAVGTHAQVDVFDPFSREFIPDAVRGAVLRGFFVFHPESSLCIFRTPLRRQF